MHDLIAIVENTRVQFLPGAQYKGIKILCLNVLNDDTGVGMIIQQNR